MSGVTNQEYENRQNSATKQNDLQKIVNEKNEINNVREIKMKKLKQDTRPMTKNVCQAIEWINRNRQNLQGFIFFYKNYYF